jgi:hypothetical protein
MYLEPKDTIFQTAPDGTLRVLTPDRCGLQVQVLRAFPLSYPEEHIVLRDGGGGELGMLRDLRDLQGPARDLLREELRRRYFLPVITQIYDIAERFGSSVWDLQTDRGRCTVTTRQMNESVAELEAGRYIITDVDGNRYEIKDLTTLDADTRARFLGKY